MTDEELIRKTLRLAARGRGYVSPNPLVGAVIVKDGKIVAEGYHRKFGELHAEAAALNSTQTDVSKAVLYVNLEPCSHFGKQPPCVGRILNSGIEKVVVGTTDPNPLINGTGVAKLRAAGVEVKVGVLEKRCRELNSAFFKHVKTGLPFITLKIAQTLDGKIAAADGKSKWITSEKSRRTVHKMRSENDAVLVGVGTVLSDDPSLNVRMVKGVHPRRIVLDSKLRTPLNAKILNDGLVGKTMIMTTEQAPPERIEKIKSKGAHVWITAANSDGHIDLKAACEKLGKEGITSILVEGGGQVFSAFLQEKLADRISIFVAPKILGGGMDAIQNLGIDSLEQSIALQDFHKQKMGEDVLLTGKISGN